MAVENQFGRGPQWARPISTYVDVTIRNPADPQRSWTGKFLVDTRAFDSLVPKAQLKTIGLKPRGRREYVLADGKPVALDITIAEIEPRLICLFDG